MTDDNDETLTPAEIAAGLTPETKREQEEESGIPDVPVRQANERARARAAKTILRSAAKLKRLPSMLGRVHSDI